MILHVDSISLRRQIRWLCLLFLFAASIQWTGATALAQAVDARVASVKGTALRRNNQRAFALARGDSLNPGDEIDTRGGGRVVIELTDGSVVVVHPNSRIVISDYRAAASLRAMFRILIGRVRVKIAHYGGKPNPYRVNSPTASILVRGTEFSVIVESSGDTRVVVYEGLVEVESLSDPRFRALVAPGRGALVKPNEDIRFFTPGNGSRPNERGDRNDDGDNGGDSQLDDLGVEVEVEEKRSDAQGSDDDVTAAPASNTISAKKMPAAQGSDDDVTAALASNAISAKGKPAAQGSGGNGPQRNDLADIESMNWSIRLAQVPDSDDLQPNDLADIASMNWRIRLADNYKRYSDNIVGRGQWPPLQRFVAFADSHFDSLDNPAYATEFTSIEGRFWLIPSFNRAQGGDLRIGSAVFPFSGGNPISPFDSGLLAQGDFFIPLESARAVIGGVVAVSRNRSQSLTVDPASASLIRFFPKGSRVERYVALSTEGATITGLLMAARRFGDEGRTSIGAGVEWVSGGADLRGQSSLAIGARAFVSEELKADSQINRLLFRLGMTRELNGGHKLGLGFSHGLATAEDSDLSRLFNGLPLNPDSTRQEGRSSEISFRLRGPFTRRLFYGVEGSLLWGESDEQIRRAFFTDSTARSSAGRAVAGFGLGFALRRTTVLSGDFSFGLSRAREARHEDMTGKLVEDRRDRDRFTSGRLGLQTDLWRRSFVSVSALAIWQATTTDLDHFPDLFGRRLTSLGLAESDGRSRRNATNAFWDFGAGWRFSPNLIAEYIISVNQGLGPPRHVFLLRYTFKREK